MGSSLLVDALALDTLFTSTLGLVFALMSGVDQVPLLLGETSFLESLLSNLWNYFLVALGLGFVIFVHELGHFLAAKTFGVRCDKFYVGFDVPISIGPIKFPRTLGKFQWGETEYGIGIIPLGGYVKMLGQDDDPRQAEAEAERVRLGEGEEAPLDPRSYPAKSVWQRMIIISAGVVMNLIFAVIMAGVAYWYGVPYKPTVAGGTLAGGPAWQAGIEPGDQILRISGMEDDDPNLRYQDFATGVIIRGLDKKDEKLTLAVLRGDERIEISTTPTSDYSEERYYQIGLLPQLTPTVGKEPFAKGTYLAGLTPTPDLKAGDVIKAVNGEELPIDPRFGQVIGSELTRRLQAHWRETVTLTVERQPEDESESPETLQVDLPPVPVKTLGIGFAAGPITAVQEGSPAAKADIRVGDVIEKINGEPVVDALRIPTTVARLAGKPITLTLRRSDTSPAGAGGDDERESLTENDVTSPDAESSASQSTVEVTLEGPKEPSFDTIAWRSGRLTLGGLGAAFDVDSTVTYVDPKLSDTGIAVGDKLAKYHWIVTAAEKKELSSRFRSIAFEPEIVDPFNNVPVFFDFLQGVPEGSKMKLFLQREGKTREATLEVNYADDWYWSIRSLALAPLQQIHQTDSVATAAALGLWETERRFHDVLNFLRLLATFKIGAKGLGGPVLIAQAASAEASNGVPRLLLFLTLLSANLAILNFLPIPALDGGHMVFLTAEAIRGKPVSEALQVRLTMVGVLGLLSLMAFVIVNDILRLYN